MTDLTLSAFCKKFSACSNGISFGKGLTKRKGSAKMSKLWDMHIQNRGYLLWVATREGVFPDIALRKMALAFAREVESLHPICKPTLDVVEKYIDGEATEKELIVAGAAARAAAWAAAWAAAGDVAWAAAGDAAWAAAGDAAEKRQVEIIYSFSNPFANNKEHQ